MKSLLPWANSAILSTKSWVNPMIKTSICDLLGIEYPIFQGGMAWVSDGRLAAAVSNGGGLGLISAMNAGPDYLREQIQITRSLTEKPFGVNLMLLSPYADEIAQTIVEEKVAVVTTGAGNPSKYMEAWNEAGVKVIPVVPSVSMAKLVSRHGPAALIAEGGESGGHVGELTTICLVPQVCDVTDLPVIAAGGIADGRGIAAALMLGASGVQLGTRFLAATECGIHQNYKNKILKATDLSTIVTGRRLGHPVRSLKTPFSREYASLEYTDISDDDLDAFATGKLRAAAVDGDDKNGCFLAGQIAGMVKKEQPAAEMIREMFAEAEKLLNGASLWVK